MAIQITCLSDLHGSFPKFEGGDLLIVAGDLTASDQIYQYAQFFEWLARQNYRKKVIIGGNHDGLFTVCDVKEEARMLCGMGADNFEYLCDSGCEFEGLKIWGAPWTPVFFDWHFMLKREQLAEKWSLIPDDTNILITHGPPFGILDQVSPRKHYRCGCEELALRLKELHELKLHVFGHIHGGHGVKDVKSGPIYVNAAYMDEQYNPTNKPVRIEL